MLLEVSVSTTSRAGHRAYLVYRSNTKGTVARKSTVSWQLWMMDLSREPMKNLSAITKLQYFPFLLLEPVPTSGVPVGLKVDTFAWWHRTQEYVSCFRDSGQLRHYELRICHVSRDVDTVPKFQERLPLHFTKPIWQSIFQLYATMNGRRKYSRNVLWNFTQDALKKAFSMWLKWLK